MSATANPSRWQGAFEETLARGLPAFLPDQRWFGGKARRIASARAEDCAWLREEDEPCALVIAHVAYASGSPERYALLVALRREPGAMPSLGTLTLDGGMWHVLEASAGAPDAIVLLRHLDRAHDLAGIHGGILRFGDVPAGGADALDPATLDEDRVRPLGAEQSNTSLLTGTGHVFKLFRRLEAGENPEVEIGRFLATRTSFRAAPALRGSVTWLPSGRPPGTVGALQDLVKNQGDGWQWSLERLHEVLSHAAAPEPLVNEILTLGAVTAELHSALASSPDAPGFAPEPAGSADARGWTSDLRTRADRVFEMLAGGLDGMQGETRTACESLLRLRPRLEAAVRPPSVAGPGAFAKIRVHGDFHLGQTLKTPFGFVVIDFEGEPARPLAERRQLHCALKDVSGMLRSFDYAIESARRRAPEGAAWTAAPPPPLHEAFLRGYETSALASGAAFLPADAEARARWIRFFELDKALYELEYEMQNRPEWLLIPARGMIRLIGEDAP